MGPGVRRGYRSGAARGIRESPSISRGKLLGGDQATDWIDLPKFPRDRSEGGVHFSRRHRSRTSFGGEFLEVLLKPDDCRQAKGKGTSEEKMTATGGFGGKEGFGMV
jgi:hypothetical protein